MGKTCGNYPVHAVATGCNTGPLRAELASPTVPQHLTVLLADFVDDPNSFSKLLKNHHHRTRHGQRSQAWRSGDSKRTATEWHKIFWHKICSQRFAGLENPRRGTSG